MAFIEENINQILIEMRIWHKTKSISQIEGLVSLPMIETKDSPRGSKESYCRFSLTEMRTYNEMNIIARLEAILNDSAIVNDLKSGNAEGWLIVSFANIPPSVVVSTKLMGRLANYGLGAEFRIP